jgi:hypothetical protein
MAKKKKLSPAEQTRIRQVQEWLIHGHLVTDICRNIMKAWITDEPMAIRYIADAFDDFNNQVGKGYEETKAYHIQMRLSLYRKAMEAKQFKTALQILVDLGKMEDIYPD